MDNYIVLDIETTGLYYESWDEVIEVCAIKYENNENSIFHKYIKPYRQVPKQIEQLTKISNKFLETKETKYKVLPELRKFIGDLPVVAHNGSKFDVPFLNYWFYVLDLPLITKRFCTMKAFKNFTKQKNGKLCDALNFFSIVNNQAHSAIEDTKATAKLFKVLSEQYPIVFEEYSEREAYIEIMKRTCKSNSHKKIREILCDEKIAIKASNNTTLSDEEIIKCFRSFETPSNIFSKTTQDYEYILNLFNNWLNNINVSIFYKYISDQNLYKFVKSVIKYSFSYEDMINLHKEIYNTENVNLFIYLLVYKLEKDTENMKYTTEDFDYYFSRGVTIEDIVKRTSLNKDIVINLFIEWAFNNKTTKKNSISNYLVGKKCFKTVLENGPNDNKEIITYKLYQKNFFNL